MDSASWRKRSCSAARIDSARSLAHVAVDDGIEPSPADLDLGDRRFDREALAVRADPLDRAQVAHPPVRDPRAPEAPYEVGVACAHRGRDQQVEGAPHEVSLRVAEHLLGRGVRKQDDLVVADGDDAVHRRAQDGRQPRLPLLYRARSALLLGHVPQHHLDSEPVAIAQRGRPGLGRPDLPAERPYGDEDRRDTSARQQRRGSPGYDLLEGGIDHVPQRSTDEIGRGIRSEQGDGSGVDKDQALISVHDHCVWGELHERAVLLFAVLEGLLCLYAAGHILCNNNDPTYLIAVISPGMDRPAQPHPASVCSKPQVLFLAHDLAAKSALMDLLPVVGQVWQQGIVGLAGRVHAARVEIGPMCARGQVDDIAVEHRDTDWRLSDEPPHDGELVLIAERALG